MNTEHMIVRLEDGIFDACETNRQLKELLCGTKKATNQELLQEASQLKSRLAQVEREMDAAVADLKVIKFCALCEEDKKHSRIWFRQMP